MNPNNNFAPLQLLKKETLESESYGDSSLMQPPNIFSSIKDKLKKNEEDPTIQSMNNHTIEGLQMKNESDNFNNEGKGEKNEDNNNQVGTKNEEVNLDEKIKKLEMKPNKPHITIDPNLTDSKQVHPNMKGSILKMPNSPKKFGSHANSPLKKVSVKEAPEILYVEKYQQNKKACTCICRIF